jgi:hypothetical protein
MTTILPDLTTQIGHWAGFYGLIATASATLVGLLFIAVSLHLDILSNKQDSEARLAAEQTLSSFSALLVIGLIFNIPSIDSDGLGSTMVFLAAAGLIRVGILVVWHIKNDWLDRNRRPVIGRDYAFFLLRRIVYPTVTYAILALAGSQFLVGNTGGLNTLIYVDFTMLSGSLLNAWSLLIDLSHFRIRRKNDPQVTTPAP